MSQDIVVPGETTQHSAGSPVPSTTGSSTRSSARTRRRPSSTPRSTETTTAGTCTTATSSPTRSTLFVHPERRRHRGVHLPDLCRERRPARAPQRGRLRRRPVRERRLPEPHPEQRDRRELPERSHLQAELAHQHHPRGHHLSQRALQPLSLWWLAVGDRAGRVRPGGGSASPPSPTRTSRRIPMAYSANWLDGNGHPDLFYKFLNANIYNPTDTNPPSPPEFSCPTCTYQYAYKDPPTVDAAGFSAVATAMPPNRDSGSSRLHDGRTAISWTPARSELSLVGATPATDGPVLKMLSKYDPVANPTGLRTPDFGDYTPLTGSLKDAKEYIQTVIDTDPYAGCGRAYYVMLLTDGEEQPAGLPGNDPVGAVAALRSMTSSGGLPGRREDLRHRIRSALAVPAAERHGPGRWHGGELQRPEHPRPQRLGRGLRRFDPWPPPLVTGRRLGRILEGILHALQAGGERGWHRDVRRLLPAAVQRARVAGQARRDQHRRNQSPHAGGHRHRRADYSYLWRYGDADSTALSLVVDQQADAGLSTLRSIRRAGTASSSTTPAASAARPAQGGTPTPRRTRPRSSCASPVSRKTPRGPSPCS